MAQRPHLTWDVKCSAAPNCFAVRFLVSGSPGPIVFVILSLGRGVEYKSLDRLIVFKMNEGESQKLTEPNALIFACAYALRPVTYGFHRRRGGFVWAVCPFRVC